MLQGKVAFITGASRGIGKVIAESLAFRGVSVGLISKTTVSSEKLPGTVNEVADNINSNGGKALAIPLDVRDAHGCELAIEKTVTHFGKLDILINNASALWWKSIADTPIDKFDLLHDVNVRATYTLSRNAIPYLLESGGGHIITHSPPLTPEYVKSMVNNGGMANRVAYMSSKYGMSIITMALAEELRGKNIACNTIWPSTPIESQAVKNHNLGNPRLWRKPEIVSDAIYEILKHTPSDFNGNSCTDQEYLEKFGGISDFTKYQCVPGSEPPSLEKILTVKN
jgi:citronellol/citronellal dehydrogenase